MKTIIVTKRRVQFILLASLILPLIHVHAFFSILVLVIKHSLDNDVCFVIEQTWADKQTELKRQPLTLPELILHNCSVR